MRRRDPGTLRNHIAAAVAAALGCSERTVKSQWKEAREAVRDRLDGEPPA